MRENRIFVAKSTEKDKKRKDLPLKTAIFAPITFIYNELKQKIHCRTHEAFSYWLLAVSYWLLPSGSNSYIINQKGGIAASSLLHYMHWFELIVSND